MITQKQTGWSVYRHTTPDGKVYIGATSKLPRVRWNYGYGYRNSSFYNAIQQFGWNNILHEVIATSLTEEQAYALEEKLIAEHDATNPERGYNRAVGGKGSWGVQISEDTRERLRTNHIGKKQVRTEEWNRKISEANRGRKNPHEGVPRSEDCRRKISKSHAKPVLQFDKDGNFIAEYPSARIASKETGVANQGISKCCLGKGKTSGGYIWMFKDKLGGNTYESVGL